MTSYSGRWQARRGAQTELLRVVDRLIAQFPDRCAGSIIGQVAAVREALLRAGMFESLAPAVEMLVRERLFADEAA
jgi:hypothetical protein